MAALATTTLFAKSVSPFTQVVSASLLNSQPTLHICCGTEAMVGHMEGHADVLSIFNKTCRSQQLVQNPIVRLVTANVAQVFR